jgi:hypothetical protein
LFSKPIYYIRPSVNTNWGERYIGYLLYCKRELRKKIRGDLRRRIPYLDGDERNLESVCDEESEKQSRE